VYYPRSFLKFILLGFLLVSAPLVYALGELILSVDRLQEQGREAVRQAADAARASRQLYEQATMLERIVRQHLILDDAALLDDYARVQQEFRHTTGQLGLLPLAREHVAALDALAESENRLHRSLVAPNRSPEVHAQLAAGYAGLSDGAQAMLGAANQLAERVTDRLQQIASEGREKWLYLAAATAAIALALAILFAMLIARPIRQLDVAVRRMGDADFTHAIEVNGPQDLRYLGQRLEWLRARLQALEEQQNRFLRHVSHELKTPLTAVREGAELLRDDIGGKLAPEQREIVRIVRENTLSLQKLIEDLLSYHQARASGLPAPAKVALPDVVRRVVREHKLAAIARLATVAVNVRAATVLGDREKLRTIVDNLVSNAIKYSPRSGTITVELGVDGASAVLDVVDEGPGVDRDERQRIFESFYQGRPPTDGRVKGSGLGLAIAREYALAHGGRIEVRDRADGRRGAHFRLWLPLAATAGTSAGAPPVGASERPAATSAATSAGVPATKAAAGSPPATITGAR
jgi:two-component system sensor histidine kinase GlrK